MITMLRGPELDKFIRMPKPSVEPHILTYPGEARDVVRSRQSMANDLHAKSQDERKFYARNQPEYDPRRGLYLPPIAGGAVLTTESWTDNVGLISIQTVALQAVLNTTFSLDTKIGAFIHLWMGRGGPTALTNGVDVRVSRTYNNGANGLGPTAPLVAVRSQSAAAVAGVCAGSGNNAGVTSLTLNVGKTFVSQDLLAVQDAGTPTTASEWCLDIFETSTTVKKLESATISAHNSTAHTVANKSDYWTFWVDGGKGATTSHKITIDYGNNAAGDTIMVYAVMQTFDSLSSA